MTSAGRRPTGLVSGEQSNETLASYFTECAWLEAASVIAFEELAASLESLGASRDLITRCLTAAEQERRHERATFALARRFGAARRRPIERTATSSRTVFDLARANAVEGVVRETFGAVVATFSAIYGCDAEVRSVMREIAPDECEHAELAACIAEFVDPLLTSSERDAVADARATAIADLRMAVSHEPPVALRDLVGLPTASEAVCVLDALTARAWPV